MMILRVGTRRSALAMAQARQVADALAAKCAHLRVELVPIVSEGDRTAGPLMNVGGKGLFTSDLERALAEGAIEVAVHSAKDLPSAMDASLTIAAVPSRADVRDALVSRFGPVTQLPRGASVGTGSPRRAAQITAVREDIEIVPIRGNVETRLRRAFDKGDGSLDGVVLAMAGLERSGLLDAHRDTVYPFDLETCTPAGGQGALAVQARADDIQTRQTVVIVDNPQAHAALLAERYILRSLGAQCRSCLAVHVAPDAANDWVACAMFARPDGSELRRATAKSESAETAGKILLGRLLKMGAHEVICDAI